MPKDLANQKKTQSAIALNCEECYALTKRIFTHPTLGEICEDCYRYYGSEEEFQGFTNRASAHNDRRKKV